MQPKERIEYLEGKVQMLTAVIVGSLRNSRDASALKDRLSRLSMKGEGRVRGESFLQGMEDARNDLLDLLQHHLKARER